MARSEGVCEGGAALQQQSSRAVARAAAEVRCTSSRCRPAAGAHAYKMCTCPCWGAKADATFALFWVQAAKTQQCKAPGAWTGGTGGPAYLHCVPLRCHDALDEDIVVKERPVADAQGWVEYNDVARQRLALEAVCQLLRNQAVAYIVGGVHGEGGDEAGLGHKPPVECIGEEGGQKKTAGFSLMSRAARCP